MGGFPKSWGTFKGVIGLLWGYIGLRVSQNEAYFGGSH